MNGTAGTEIEREGFCNKKADRDIFRSTYAEICGALHENIRTCTNGEQLEAAAKARNDSHAPRQCQPGVSSRSRYHGGHRNTCAHSTRAKPGCFRQGWRNGGSSAQRTQRRIRGAWLTGRSTDVDQTSTSPVCATKTARLRAP
ncbi:hypothetical protein CBL_21498 [Carabus blaptoides fortunei]